MTDIATRCEWSISFDLPMFVGAGLYFVTFFSKSFSGIHTWKNLSTYLVISSCNSHLLSSVLEKILSFFWTIISTFHYLIPKKNLIIGMEKRIFLNFSPFFFNDFFFSVYGVSTASGSGWAVSTGFGIVLLLDGPCKLTFYLLSICYLPLNLYFT